MSKATELALLERSRSIDAPIGVRQRSGDRENVGQMLDVYVNVESAEDEYLRNEESARKELFLKGFRLLVKKLYTEKERRFLSALMSKKVNLVRLFRYMKFNEFRELKRLQEKAQANVGILKKLSELSGWSGSEEFISEFFARMERAQGCEGTEEGTLNALVERRIAYRREYRKRDYVREREREYRKRDYVRERLYAWMREYIKRDYVRERINAYRRKYEKLDYVREHKNEWRRKNRLLPEVREREAAYYKREDVKEHRNARRREYRKREDVRARETEYTRRYRQDPVVAEKHREEVREYYRRHAEENRARVKAWRIANRERYNEIRQEARRRKKEEKERLSNVVS